MSDLSGDPENDYLSEHVNITGSSGSTEFSDSNDCIGALAGQAGRTLDIFNIPTSRGESMLTGHA